MSDDSQGNGTPQVPQGGSAPGAPPADGPKYVTIDELNRAITARLSDHAKKTAKDFESTFESRFGAFTTSLDEKLARLAPATPESAPQKGKGKDDRDHEANIAEHPEFKKLSENNAKLQKAFELQQKAAAESQAKERAHTLRATLSDALTKSGIRPDALGLAVGKLIQLDGRVAWGDGDAIVYRDADGTEHALADGLSLWLKSGDANLFLPPRIPGGSGGGPGSRGGPPNQNDPDQVIKGLIGSTLLGNRG
jgi:hypothetical protein